MLPRASEGSPMGLYELPLAPKPDAPPSDVSFIVAGGQIDSLLPRYWQVHEQGTPQQLSSSTFS